MKTTIKILTLTLSTFFFLNPFITKAKCHIDDWTALKTLYESTDGVNWKNNTNWKEVTGNAPTANCNLENLRGVGLNANERVNSLRLSSNQLIGSIPPKLGNLSNLTDLSLSWNQLSGSIPPELGNLSNLTDLSLSSNQLSGSIPSELGNLSNLTDLSLSSNQLSGSIPPELGNLSNLKSLYLYSNQLSGIPPELGNLSNLKSLYLSRNQLSGSIPPELGNLNNLTDLSLSWNQLSGSIPPELGNLSNLTDLSLYINQLGGSIPPELGNLSNLTDLSFSSNQLSGSIPPELGNLSNLERLHLENNQLSGSIPPELGNLSNLGSLYLENNQLSGSIPPELGNLSNLDWLYLSNNQLSGSIPRELGNLNNLKDLEINDNDLNGCFPNNIIRLCWISTRVMSDGNNFDAPWEDFCATDAGICNLRVCHIDDWIVLKELYESTDGDNWINKTGWDVIEFHSSPPPSCSLTNMTGVVLDEIGRVVELNLNNNQINGSIPPELGSLSNLTKLVLFGNQLTGNIPPELGDLSNLDNLWLGDNNLIGSIPPELGNLSNLDNLSINDNDLNGCFPANISTFCTDLAYSLIDGNPDIIDSNNFDATWEDFCTTGAGVCSDCEEDCVWPGDINVDGRVDNKDISISHIHIGENGPPRNIGGTSWEAQLCENWGIQQSNGHDIKHHDCDGNGNINSNDANAIYKNYDKTYFLPSGISAPSIPVYTNTDYQIVLQPISQISSNSNNLVMHIVLDSKFGQNLEVFGGYFSIDYSNIVAYVDTAFMDFESFSWLGIPNVDLLADSWHNAEEHTIEVGFTKTNGQASIGKGIIGQVIFKLNTSNLRLNNNCEDLLDVAITKIGAFNAQQDTLKIENECRLVNLSLPCCEPFINIDEGTPFQNVYTSSGTIITNGYLPVDSNQIVLYQANEVILNEGFSVKAGAKFEVRVGGCN